MAICDKTEISEISPHKRRYWRYQYDLAKNHIIPLLQEWGFDPCAKKILDIGCAEGGAMAALEDEGARCEGVEINASRVELGKALCNKDKVRNLRFIVGDITKDSILKNLKNRYDLILLRDVIEHLWEKAKVLTGIKNLLNSDGCIMISFPPFYSPFGGHQQMLSSRWRYFPYIHLLPRPFFDVFSFHLSCQGDNRFILEEMKLFRRERLSLQTFEKLINQLGLKIAAKKLYLSRPSHQLRYGFKIVEARGLGQVPLVRELLVSGAFYLLQPRTVNNGK